MSNRILRVSQAALYASLPMSGAAIGAVLDERHHLGFTTWRTACRGVGLRISSLIEFTFQLLPMAIVGLLLGGLVVLAAGVLLRDCHARLCVAAHAGCAVTLPVALILCAFLPPALMLALDAALATLAAVVLLMWMRSPSRGDGAHP